jgi:hypothetical protein
MCPVKAHPRPLAQDQNRSMLLHNLGGPRSGPCSTLAGPTGVSKARSSSGEVLDPARTRRAAGWSVGRWERGDRTDEQHQTATHEARGDHGRDTTAGAGSPPRRKRPRPGGRKGTLGGVELWGATTPLLGSWVNNLREPCSATSTRLRRTERFASGADHDQQEPFHCHCHGSERGSVVPLPCFESCSAPTRPTIARRNRPSAKTLSGLSRTM